MLFISTLYCFQILVFNTCFILCIYMYMLKHTLKGELRGSRRRAALANDTGDSADITN